MQTVSYMIEGYFQHEDSVGHKGTIGPGDLQWMVSRFRTLNHRHAD